MTHLRIVSLDEPVPPRRGTFGDQILLRPTLRFADLDMGRPWRVVVLCRRPRSRVRLLLSAALLDYQPRHHRSRPEDQLTIPWKVRRKSTTIRCRPLTADERRDRDDRHRQLGPPLVDGRCVNTVRPCVHTSCSMHLATDITDSGSLKLNFGGNLRTAPLTVLRMQDSCALDLAKDGPQTTVRIGEAMNVSHQRAEQMVTAALGELSAKCEAFGLAWDEKTLGPRPKK